MLKTMRAAAAVGAVMVAGLVGVAASPADAYATCHRVYSDTNWAPSTGHYCTYRNQRISSTEKLRTIKLYKNGRKRALARITAWSSDKEYPVVCDTKARLPSTTSPAGTDLRMPDPGTAVPRTVHLLPIHGERPALDQPGIRPRDDRRVAPLPAC